MSEKFPLTVALIVKNEEKKLDECLQSVLWADELVVVNDQSTDRTVEIAKKYTDRIFHRAMDIEGRQRNFAYSQARNEWVLSLDADERVSPELTEEIRRVLSEKNHQCNAYAIPIRSYLGKRWIRGAGHYGARIRLFRKDFFRYEEAGVHPKVLLNGDCGYMKHDIIHFAYRDFADLLNRFNRETDLEAEKWILDGRRVSLPNILRKVADRFLKNYFLKGGWRDGFRGFFMSTLHSFYQLLSYAKYREKREWTSQSR
jgi:glycosyltransferase involved in cell wall biosynthesis